MVVDMGDGKSQKLRTRDSIVKQRSYGIIGIPVVSTILRLIESDFTCDLARRSVKSEMFCKILYFMLTKPWIKH